MSRGSQAGPGMGAAWVNTARVEVSLKKMYSCWDKNICQVSCQGMSHTEGGWPRDVNPADAEQKSRYRKKLEKDEDFLLKTRHLVRETERFVRQNNCIDIFEVELTTTFRENLPSAR